MIYIEYSFKEIEEKSIAWANEIEKTFHPELVVYIARAGYLFAKPIAEHFQATLLGAGAVRKGNGIKEIVGPLFAHCPKALRNGLARLELRSGLHKRHEEREVRFHESVKDIDSATIRSVLIVDDALDTGYTMKSVLALTQRVFAHAEIKTACFNMSCKEEDSVIPVDYIYMQGASVKTPFSKDAIGYRQMKERYQSETRNEYI